MTPQQQLQTAITDSNDLFTRLAAIEKAIEAGADLHKPLYRDIYAIHFLVAENAPETLRALCYEYTVDLDLHDQEIDSRQRPLVHAVQIGSVTMIATLLELGSSPHPRPADGPVPAVEAVSGDAVDLSTLRTLHAYGADLDKADPQTGDTVVHRLASQGRKVEHIPEIVAEFDLAADITNQDGFTPKDILQKNPYGDISLKMIDKTKHQNALETLQRAMETRRDPAAMAEGSGETAAPPAGFGFN